MHNFKNDDGLKQDEFYDLLNGLLKDAETEEDLQAIIDKAESETVHPVYFIMKRSGKAVTEFFITSDRVKYILDDGVGVRRSKISNLYKNVMAGV